jgi:hypothetical protein
MATSTKWAVEDINLRRGRASCSLRRRLGRGGLVVWVVLGQDHLHRFRGRRRIGDVSRVTSLGRVGEEEVKEDMEEEDVEVAVVEWITEVEEPWVVDAVEPG